MSVLARTAACCLILLISMQCNAQDPVPDPVPSPTVPVIVLPHTGGDIVPDPGPPPQPRPVNPAVIDTLSPDVWYVIESSVPLIILHSPDGLIGVAEETGPLKLRGRFADEPTKVQTRTYTAANLYILDAVKAGKTELLVIPKGVESAAGIIRQVLTVSGSGPQPPPDPPDPPGPPPGPVTSFRVIFVKESGSTLDAQQTAIPGAKAIREYLSRKTTPEGGLVGWREYDPDQNVANEQPTMRALWEAVKPKLLPSPCLVIEVNGKATVMPFPATVSDAVKLLKQYGGE